MNRITRKRSPRWGSSKGKPNPFESRGLDKFQEVYSELERMRYRIAEEEGVSTSDVWFTRATSNSSSRDWIPVVVGRSRSSSTASRLEKKASIPHWEEEQQREEQSPEEAPRTGESCPPVEIQSQSQSLVRGFTSWFVLRLEHLLHDMQHGARKALKAITLFIMIVAAVSDVLVALVAGFMSSLIARYLRPLWARYLPFSFSQQHNKDLSFAFPVALGSINTTASPCPSMPCVSAPSSPRCHQARSESPKKTAGGLRGSGKQGSSVSTPVSPMRSGSPTYFSSARPALSSSPERRVHGPQRLQKNPVDLDCFSPAEEQRGVTPVMCIVLVILVGLSFGRVTAALMASAAWFLFPVVEKFRGKNNGLRRA